jgi:hypothetical protein
MKRLNNDLLDSTIFPDTSYPKVSPGAFRWKKSAIIGFSIFCLVAAWFSHADLFSIPKDVKQSRELYFTARDELGKDPIYWRDQRYSLEKRLGKALFEKNGLEMTKAIQSITPHALIDFLSEQETKSSSLAITPKFSGSSLVLVATKPERLFWPFSTMLSLEIEVRFTSEGILPTFIRLRRGSQEFSPTLAWSYFGPELEMLKKSSNLLLSKTH